MNKKFALLLVLVAAMVMGSVASASAADVKATGSWTISAEIRDRQTLNQNEGDTFNVYQRARTAFQFIANENLKGVLNTQIGTGTWGSGLFQIGAGRNTSATAGGAAAAGNGNIMLREGYVEFKVPGTQALVKGGFQGISLPSAVGGGSPIFDDQVGALVSVLPVMDSLSLVGGYARPTQGSGNNNSGSSFDMGFLIADVKPMKGLNFQPYVAYGYAGAEAVRGLVANTTGTNPANPGTSYRGLASSYINSTVTSINAYFAGTSATVDLFSPVKLMADLHYGKAAASDKSNRSGWMFDFQADYTGLSMMTPSLFFAYTSGEDGDSTKNNKSERIPVIGRPQNYALSTFWFQGSNSLWSDSVGGDTSTNMGFWTVGLNLKDIKLIDKLSHTFSVLYVKGTNNDNWAKASGTYGSSLSTKDSLWEVDLNTKYEIYSELAAHLELGYINPDFNKTTWATTGTSSQLNKDAYKAAVILNYSF